MTLCVYVGEGYGGGHVTLGEGYGGGQVTYSCVSVKCSGGGGESYGGGHVTYSCVGVKCYGGGHCLSRHLFCRYNLQSKKPIF